MIQVNLCEDPTQQFESSNRFTVLPLAFWHHPFAGKIRHMQTSFTQTISVTFIGAIGAISQFEKI